MSKLKLYHPQQFDELRKQEDPLADQAVMDLINFPGLSSEINRWEEIPSKIPAHFPASLHLFFEDYNNPATIQERKSLCQGQAFFNRRGDRYLAMLGFYSLPYCYAFANGAEVLVRSKRILEDSGKRLGETAKFLLDVFKPGAFIDSNQAFLTCAKIRLIHAYSRYFIHHYAHDWKPEFGQPINQEDLIGTNLAFSLLVVRGMRKIGASVTKEESEHLLAYWKYLGKLLGIQTEFWPETTKEAFVLEQLIRKRHLRNSAAGEKLIQSLLSYFEQNQKETLLKGKSEALVSFLVGKEASQALGIKSEPIFIKEVVGSIFKLLGWKNYAGNQSHARFMKEFELSYTNQFGEAVQIHLPERKRS